MPRNLREELNADGLEINNENSELRYLRVRLERNISSLVCLLAIINSVALEMVKHLFSALFVASV